VSRGRRESRLVGLHEKIDGLKVGRAAGGWMKSRWAMVMLSGSSVRGKRKQATAWFERSGKVGCNTLIFAKI
jgi:hypothetical protein